MQTLVIGGGLIALATAKALIERGEKVRVIEAREGVGLETSFANGGVLTLSMSEPWNGPGVYSELAASLLRPSPSMQLRFRAIPSFIFWRIAFLRNATPDRFFATTADNYELATYSRDKTLLQTQEKQLACDQLDAGTLCVFRDEDEMVERRGINNHIASCGMTYREDGKAWAGLQPISSDRRPYIGPTGIAGLYVNAGHGALGWTMAMGSAHLIVDQILQSAPAIDQKPFLPNRH